MSISPQSHNDEPAKESSIGNKAFGHNALLDEIYTEITYCKPPKGIGINGYWGTGKTSFLSQLFSRLNHAYPDGSPAEGTPKQDTDCYAIWFEAWRYQQESLPIVALLNEIRSQMSTLYKLRHKGKKIGMVVLAGIMSSLDNVIKAASVGVLSGVLSPQLVGSLQASGETWEQENHQYNLPGQQIRALLREAIAEVVGKDGRLVIFIDDLDRCEAETAFRLLEGIKVYLNLDNCVVVFAMDQRQIEEALNTVLTSKTDGRRNSHRAREYLEKICPDIHYLPIADQAKKTEFFIVLLEDLKCCQPNVHKTIRTILDRADCLPANPRKIKILVNRVALMLRKIENTIEKNLSLPELQLLLIIASLYCYHPKMYEQAEQNPDYLVSVFTYISAYFPHMDSRHSSTKKVGEDSDTSLGEEIGANSGDQVDKRGEHKNLDHILRSSLPINKKLMLDVILPFEEDQSAAVLVNPSDSNVFRVYHLIINYRDEKGIPLKSTFIDYIRDATCNQCKES